MYVDYAYRLVVLLLGEDEYKWIARIEKFRHENGWQHFAADFTMDSRG